MAVFTWIMGFVTGACCYYIITHWKSAKAAHEDYLDKKAYVRYKIAEYRRLHP